MRIIAIILAAFLFLSLFEHWRYRSANQKFEALHQSSEASARALKHTTTGMMYLWDEVFRSGLLPSEHLQPVQSTMDSVTSEDEVSIFGAIRFDLIEPLELSDLETVEQIIANLRSRWEESLWKFSYELTNEELRLEVQSKVPITDRDPPFPNSPIQDDTTQIET